MLGNLLESFYILFKIDSGEADKKLENLDKELKKTETLSNTTSKAVTGLSTSVKNVGTSKKIDLGLEPTQRGLKGTESAAKKTTSAVTSLDKEAKKLTVDLAISGHELDNAAAKITNVGSKAKKTSSVVDKAFAKMRASILQLTAATTLLAGFKFSVEFADNLGKIAQQARVDVGALDAWGQAVKSAGGDAHAFNETVKKLNDDFSQVAVLGTSDSAIYFRQIGVALKDTKGRARDVLDVLPEIATAFQRLSNAQQRVLGGKLGLDEGTILLLQRGRAAVDDLVKHQKSLGVVTKENTELSRKFVTQEQDTMHAFRSLGQQIASALLPHLTTVLKAIENVFSFIARHHNLVVGALKVIGIAAVGAAGAFALLRREAILAALPFVALSTAVVAAGAAIAFLYDDIKTFQEGGDSVIGLLLDKLPKLPRSFRQNNAEIASASKELYENLKGLGQELDILFKDIATHPGVYLNKIKDFLANSFTAILNQFPKLKSAFDVLKSEMTLAGDLVYKVWSRILEVIERVVSSIKNGIGAVASAYKKLTGQNRCDKQEASVSENAQSRNENKAVNNVALRKETPLDSIDEIKKTVTVANTVLLSARNTPLNAQPNNTVFNQNQDNSAASRNISVHTGEINIQTQASDSKEIAFNFADHLKREMRQAVSHYDNGVLA